MFCRQCGKQIPDDSRFCPECGEKVFEDSLQQRINSDNKHNLQSKGNSIKQKKRTAIIFAVLMSIIIVFALALSFSKPKINLNDYIVVSFEGYDGQGYASIEFDYDKLLYDHGNDILSAYQSMHKNDSVEGIMSEFTRKNEIDYDRLVQSFIDEYIDGSLDRGYGLSNGDIITYIWNCKTDLVLDKTGIKLICDDKKFIVAGLEEVAYSDDANDTFSESTAVKETETQNNDTYVEIYSSTTESSYYDSNVHEDDTDEGIIFPNSSYEIIDEYEIRALSNEELRYAINEIYARNGYRFRDDGLRAFYLQYDWYDPHIAPEDFTLDSFNEVEYKNIDTMQKERDSRK